MIKKNITKLIKFFKEDIWRVSLKRSSPVKRFFIQLVWILITSIKQFNKDHCQLRSSALTFYSLLSIVPILAMLFSIAKGFELEKHLEKSLYHYFSQQKEILDWSIKFSYALLEQTKGGIIAGIGAIFLFLSTTKVLRHLEDSFNHIWQTKQSRSFMTQLSRYLVLIVICPIFFIISSSLTIYLSQFKPIQSIPTHIFFVKLSSYLFTWFLFTLLYLVIPNTKVKLSSAVVSGILVGSLYKVIQWGYINFQVGIAGYGAIYGSFSALPLFLIWLQLSWIILLAGSEFCYALQYVKTYAFQQDISNISENFKQKLSILIACYSVDFFKKGQPPLTIEKIALHLEIPIKLTQKLIENLVKANILQEVILKNSTEQAHGYPPALDISNLKVQDIIYLLEHSGTNSIPVTNNSTFKNIQKKLLLLQEEQKNSKNNFLLKEIN